MLKIIPCCDMCGEPLFVEEINCFGYKIPVVKSAKPKEYGFSSRYSFCQMCADKIDNEVLKLRLEMMSLSK